MNSNNINLTNMVKIIDVYNSLIVHHKSLYRARRELYERKKYIQKRSQYNPLMSFAATAINKERIEELFNRTNYLWKRAQTLMNADQKQTLYTLDFESLIPPPKKYVIDRKELIIRFRLMSIVFPVSYRNTLESKKQTELLDTLLDKTLTLIEYLKIYAITRYKDLLDLQEIEEIEEKEKSDFPFPHYTTQHITIHGHGNVIGNQNTSDVKEVYNPDNKTNE